MVAPLCFAPSTQLEPIQVCLRLRPMDSLEVRRRSHDCITLAPDDPHTLTVTSPLQGSYSFQYNNAICPSHASQEEVYQHAAAPLAEWLLEGFHCALLAYGPTGSGKTYTMMGKTQDRTTTTSPSSSSGMIPRLIQDIFAQMSSSPSTVEYIVRCSFVEIYLEKLLDLLHPMNRNLTLNDNELQGASEACCLTPSDCYSLLIRGNAARSVSSTKMNTDSSRSHAMFVMKLEQRDTLTGISKYSTLSMMDMAGSELGKQQQYGSGSQAMYQEAKMINQSLTSLQSHVGVVQQSQQDLPHGSSKLTKLLRDAFGGNCRTSIILTASPASYNIDESIRTMKFGMSCQRIHNPVQPSVEMSPVDYRKLLNDSQTKQSELMDLVKELSAECFQLKQDATKNTFVESKYNGPLWDTVESILVNGASSSSSLGKNPSWKEGSSDVAALREELAKARAEVESSKKVRGHLENVVSERQSEVAVLRTQNENYSMEMKKTVQELSLAQAEIRILSQRKQEVEHNLRTSQFREYEATVFLRQFRRFYRRLLKNKAAQGTGGTSDVIEKVPGVPDLNDLIDVDTLLLESGLIEESELHDDTVTGAYRPSVSALGRSTEASSKAWKEAATLGKVEELTALDRSSFESRRRPPSTQTVTVDTSDTVGSMDGADAGAGSSKMPYGQTITNRQQFLRTPAGRLTTMRERELERDLLRATERCIELQVALNEEKANVDILTNRAGNLNKKKFAQESIQLKQQLEKKTHDLQAIIWKMNELHLINKTYNEKMSNREQHVTYLEENLVGLQSSNRDMIMERQEAEDKLREELESLKVLVDAMTIPLWQFGECGVTGRTLASRICLPVRGGGYVDDDEDKNDDESMESLEESVVSEEEEDEESVEVEVSDQPESRTEVPVAPQPTPVQQVQIIQQSNVPMRDASTQTLYSSQEKGTMTDVSVAPPSPPPRPSTYASKDTSQQTAEVTVPHSPMVSSSAASNSAQHEDISSKSVPPPPKKAESTNHASTSDDLFRGGKTPSSQPRRSVQKFGLMIRPGVLKESSSKPKDSSSRTKS